MSSNTIPFEGAYRIDPEKLSSYLETEYPRDMHTDRVGQDR